MLTFKRFKELADSYGAQLHRWPEDMRGDAEALLETSAEARRLLADEGSLDDAIRSASARQDAGLWAAGEQSAALERIRASVASRIAAPPRRKSGNRLVGRVPVGWGRWRWSMTFGTFGVVTGSGLAVVAGLLIGSAYSPTPDTPSMLTMLEQTPLQIAAAD